MKDEQFNKHQLELEKAKEWNKGFDEGWKWANLMYLVIIIVYTTSKLI
jgi:hypothetical protein